MPILTISDMAGFTRMGGMFNFVRSKDTIGFEVNRDAAWYYPDPKPAAAEISGRIAFWRGVEVSE